jgi:LPS-assembly lipoprotein
MPYGDFERILRNMLNNSNIILVDSPSKATAILVINNNTLTTSSNNVSSNTQLREYTINLTINFSVLTAKGAVVLPPFAISLNNQYTADINQVLGGNTEQENLTQEMLQDAAFRLTLILSSDLMRKNFAKTEKNTTVIK